MFIKSFIMIVLGFWIWLTRGPGKRARWVQPARVPVRPGRLGTSRRPGGDTW
jgi:hypothetical protein